MADTTDLTQIEIDVLNALSRSKTTTSAVRLAADLWAPDNTFATGDPVGLVALVLSALNDRGLVTYREEKVFEGLFRQRSIYADLPHTIRLTQPGWAACGFPAVVRVVGDGWGQGHKRHDGDRTDFRRHGESAEADPPIREEAFAHIAANPTHDHSFITGEEMGDTDMTRPYTRVTPDMLANVLEARTRLGPLASYREIAEETGESPRTVRYLLTQAPLLRRLDNGEEKVAASLKERIVKALEMLGPVKDAGELRTLLSHGDSDHDIVHVLHSLHKQGVVDFTEGRDKGEPKSISLRKKGNGRVLKDKAEVEPVAAFVADRIPESVFSTDPAMERGLKGEPMTEEVAETLAVMVAQVDEATVPKPDFPMLRDLIEREQRRITGDEKGMAYIRAAEALKDIDPDTASDLMAKASANDVPFPSPIEAEYLRYVEAHPAPNERKEPTDV